MPIPMGYAGISLYYQLGGYIRPAVVTFGVQTGDKGADEISADVVQSFSSAGSLKSRLDTNVIMNRVRVAVGTSTGEDIVSDLGYNVPGDLAGYAQPPNVAILVHKQSNRGGRRGRGRLFLPWSISQGHVLESGQIEEPHWTNLKNACTAFFTKLQTEEIPMVLLHQEGKTTAGAPDLVTGLRVDARIATQRRRLGR